MHFRSLLGENIPQQALGLALALSVLVTPASSAKFDAKSFFKYVDQSCNDKMTDLNNAGDDMFALIDAAQSTFGSWTHLKIKTFAAFFGKTDADTVQSASALVKIRFDRLKNMAPDTYSIYCDGSGIQWVTTHQEGENKDKPFADGKGRWYAPIDRRPPNTEPLYIVGTKRDDYCADLNGNPIGGVSMPNQPYVVLCPAGFNRPHKTIMDLKGKHQEKGAKLDDFYSTGSTLLHEFCHAVLGAKAVETYGAAKCIRLATSDGGPFRARTNADSFTEYAMASLLSENDWTLLGMARDPPPGSSSSVNARRALRSRQLPLLASIVSGSTTPGSTLLSSTTATGATHTATGKSTEAGTTLLSGHPSALDLSQSSLPGTAQVSSPSTLSSSQDAQSVSDAPATLSRVTPSSTGAVSTNSGIPAPITPIHTAASGTEVMLTVQPSLSSAGISNVSLSTTAFSNSVLLGSISSMLTGSVDTVPSGSGSTSADTPHLSSSTVVLPASGITGGGQSGTSLQVATKSVSPGSSVGTASGLSEFNDGESSSTAIKSPPTSSSLAISGWQGSLVSSESGLPAIGTLSSPTTALESAATSSTITGSPMSVASSASGLSAHNSIDNTITTGGVVTTLPSNAAVSGGSSASSSSSSTGLGVVVSPPSTTHVVTSASTSTVSVATGVLNTITTLSDHDHPTGLPVPVLVHCLFCPPQGGLVLFGYGTAPGVYPPPPDPPVPDMPTIVIGDDGIPTPMPPDEKPTLTQGDGKPTETNPSDSEPTSKAIPTQEPTITLSSTPSSTISSSSSSSSSSTNTGYLEATAAPHEYEDEDESNNPYLSSLSAYFVTVYGGAAAPSSSSTLLASTASTSVPSTFITTTHNTTSTTSTPSITSDKPGTCSASVTQVKCGGNNGVQDSKIRDATVNELSASDGGAFLKATTVAIINVTSNLPMPLQVWRRDHSDSLEFRYGDQAWNTDKDWQKAEGNPRVEMGNWGAPQEDKFSGSDTRTIWIYWNC